MTKLYYYAHLLLTSKYKLFINLAIISVIYLFLYGDKIVLCMNENTDAIAPPRPTRIRTSQPHILLREIQEYAGTQAQLLEELDKTRAQLEEVQKQLAEAKEEVANERKAYLYKDGDYRELRKKATEWCTYKDMYRTNRDDLKFIVDRYRETFKIARESKDLNIIMEFKEPRPIELPSASNHDVYGEEAHQFYAEDSDIDSV